MARPVTKAAAVARSEQRGDWRAAKQSIQPVSELVRLMDNCCAASKRYLSNRNDMAANRMAVFLTTALLGGLLSCSPPPSTLKMCQSQAVFQSRGRELAPDDTAELVEACMLSRGYVLKEDGPRCTDDSATASNPRCYYRNNLLGRISASLSAD